LLSEVRALIFSSFGASRFCASKPVQYTTTVLGLVQHHYSGTTFNPTSINNHGVVAGFAWVKVPNNPMQSERGVVWQPSTHYTILGTISEFPSFDSQANCINDAGIIVGNSFEHIPSGQYVQHPVIFMPNEIINLGVKNSGGGIATGINFANQVVGYLWFATPVPAYQAFLYQDGTMTLLGYPVPTIGYSVAYAINNNGLIVGSAQFSADTQFHAATYANGTWNDLGTLGPDFSGYAAAVNDSGTIVGIWTNRNPPLPKRGLYLSKWQDDRP
jgi:probable HAF family extracellular repeat protein